MAARQLQIRLTPVGPWHRRSGVPNFEHQTACGELVMGPYAIREFQLDENICRLCHAPHEVDEGRQNSLDDEDFEYEEPTVPNRKPAVEE